MASNSAMTKVKAILVLDLMIVSLAAGGYFYIQTFLESAIAPPPPPPKPAEFILGNMTINPSEAEIGKPITISVNVTNIGEQEGVYNLNLTINDVLEETRIIQLSGGNSTIVEFIVVKNNGGTYNVKIGDLAGIFTLVTPSGSSQPKPAEFTLYGLAITPSEGWPGDIIVISFNVRNIGDETGKTLFDFIIKDSKSNIVHKETIEVILKGGFVRTVRITFTPKTTGIYYVNVKQLGGTFKIVETGMHTLTISSSATNVDFKLDGKTYKGSFSGLVKVGEHIIEMPATNPDGTASFIRWEDGSTNPIRRINLQGPMALYAYYSGGSSCPSLFVWNGTQYIYVAEVSNHGWLGYMNYITNDPEWPIAYWRNNPWDYLKLDKNQLKLVNDTHYELILSQKWDEIFYLDAVYLVVVDHQANVDVYSTGVEQYLDPEYMGKIYTVSKNPLAPVFAINEKGEDVLPLILHRDGVFTPGVNGLLSPSWNDILWNCLTLNLGDLSGVEQIKLIVTGKVDWGAPNDYTAWVEKFFANEVPSGTQITPPPYMEVMDGNGNWVMVPWERQLPLPPDVNSRTWVVDLTGLFPADNYWIRISNFWNVTFDYIGVDVTPQEEVIIYRIDPYATLYQEFESPSASYGNFTRYGDVTPLVLSYDDEFVIGRQGDAVRLIFPVNNLPPTVEGMERDFFFFVACWFKDPAGNWGYGFDFTADPLPFQNMSGFPYPLNKENYPYELHWNYLIEYNTRTITP